MTTGTTEHIVLSAEALLQPILAAPSTKPFVVAQLGQSLDGRIATPTGESRWINKDCALDHVHRLRASVDGLSDDGSMVVEIKCGNSVYRKTAASGRIPDYYYGQLQHVLAVTGLASIDFWCYLPDCPEVLVTVPRNEDYIKRLLEKEFLFWQKVLQSFS